MRRRSRGHAIPPILLAAVLVSGSPACRSPRADPPAAVAATRALSPAERAFLDGRLDAAVELLRAHRRHPADGLLLGYALALLGDDAAAARVLDETMRTAHPTREGPRFRALLELVTGNLDGALRELETPPRDLFARVLHVEVLTLARRFDLAEKDAAALAAEYPAEALPVHARGHLETARENWPAAIEAYTRSAQLGGPNPDLDDGIAAARIALGDHAGARDAIDRCRRAFPDYTEILYQAIRLERAAPGAAGIPLDALAAEYRARSRRRDRLAEVAEWTRGA